ncbi:MULTISPECIES: hypothetical protein [Sorangium]|uniref:Uncharacterized protein n=1 Tax=Sorangium cellulosum (strain So ce56) TaxID=448385 RepID=A9FIU6_SORC5|nr:hypothetical protein [Sorangium cellulosum]CAN91889.1 hypothetical protein predicted by Glimmer/Critica [Sorangium cellulosum So ce56]
MAPQTSYSIYVRFRGRRLALTKHIRSLETARSALQALRAERFHDADQVFLVNDATKQIVDERGWEDAGGPAEDQQISVNLRLPTDGKRTERTQDAGNDEADRSLRGTQAPALLAAPAAHLAQAEGEARHVSPERRWSGVESLEPPRARLRRAMAAAQVARARHDAALEAMTRLQPGGRMDEMTLTRLNDSARMVSDRSAHIIERLEQLLKRLEGAR